MSSYNLTTPRDYHLSSYGQPKMDRVPVYFSLTVKSKHFAKPHDNVQLELMSCHTASEDVPIAGLREHRNKHSYSKNAGNSFTSDLLNTMRNGRVQRNCHFLSSDTLLFSYLLLLKRTWSFMKKYIIAHT